MPLLLVPPLLSCLYPAVRLRRFAVNAFSPAQNPLPTAGSRTVVPLLHPQQHGLPFLLTLELHCGAPAAAVTPPPAVLDRSLYALHYVLAGSGELVRASGGAEQLQAGDSVLMHSGAAACGGGGGGVPADAGHLLDGSPWQLAELVAYMPRHLFEQQQQSKQPAQAEQQLNEREWARMLHSARLQPLLASSSSSGGSGSSATSVDAGGAAAAQLPEEFVGALLAGARETARQLLLQDHDQQSSSSGDSASGSSRPAANGSGNRSSSRGLPLPAALQAAASSLAGWWAEQQQRTCPVTKRTLSELTAFRLPNQTNRLAVQFDPFSRPQVGWDTLHPPVARCKGFAWVQRDNLLGGRQAGCPAGAPERGPLCPQRDPSARPSRGRCTLCSCAMQLPLLVASWPSVQSTPPPPPPGAAPWQVPFISGIEVFERGHRTTPHVHPHAHELFFILAGEGVGFCGEQRFPGTRCPPAAACRGAGGRAAGREGRSKPGVALFGAADSPISVQLRSKHCHAACRACSGRRRRGRVPPRCCSRHRQRRCVPHVLVRTT